MPRLVFTPRYLKMQKPSQVKNYVKYVATRPNAEKFEVNQSQTEATEHQKKWIEKELKAHKELRESCEQEYEDYLQNPTRENAMELINKIAEEGLAREDSMENYVGYLAKRPRAERGKQGHALWNGSDKEIDLNQVAREAAEHNGNIWTFVLSLKREDAVRLGYDQANMWRELVRSKSDEIAKAMWIPTENFVWYGAFHNEGHHPHIHLMCYSKNPREGYLGRQNLMKLRSSFANEIFHDELYHIYEQKDEVRDELKDYFDRKLKQAMTMEYTDNPKAEALLWELSQKLKAAKHKKVYGRLEKENGDTAFRAGVDKTNSTANHYKDSDLHKKMEGIANRFSDEDKANIVARNMLDNIAGESPTDQLVWPVSDVEWESIDQSLRAFPADYWTREDTTWTVFEDNDNEVTSYNALCESADGQGCTAGILCNGGTPVTESFAVRPALYVKAEALKPDDGKQAAPLIGGKVDFGGRDWYIVGMGDVGAVKGPASTVTLFAPTLLTNSSGGLIQTKTSPNYSEGQLCTVLQGLGNTLGLSAQEKALISNRTLTTADEITGDSVTTAFWSLSKSEFETIQKVNPSLLKDLKADTGSYNGFYYSLRTPDGAEKVYSVTEHGELKSDKPYNDYVRPAFYLDLSELFFAAGWTSVAWKKNPPQKIEPPAADYNVWTFVLYDRANLSLKMGCKKDQTGESLTFKYEGTQGENHWLSYVLEKTDNPGIPLYYGSVASLEKSGSGTVTVPLLGYGSDLEDGEYTLRFYTEDQSNMGFYLASDTVDMTICVAGSAVSITDMGNVGSILGIIDVTVEPKDITLEAGKPQQFTATVRGGGDWYD